MNPLSYWKFRLTKKKRIASGGLAQSVALRPTDKSEIRRSRSLSRSLTGR
jgi:hypothetical protein